MVPDSQTSFNAPTISLKIRGHCSACGFGFWPLETYCSSAVKGACLHFPGNINLTNRVRFYWKQDGLYCCWCGSLVYFSGNVVPTVRCF